MSVVQQFKDFKALLLKILVPIGFLVAAWSGHGVGAFWFCLGYRSTGGTCGSIISDYQTESDQQTA